MVQLEVTQDECLSLQSQTRSTAQQENHWSCELSNASSQLRLAEDRVAVLEQDRVSKESRVIELEARLEAAQMISAAKLTEVCVMTYVCMCMCINVVCLELFSLICYATK